jgi:hypothetical protein
MARVSEAIAVIDNPQGRRYEITLDGQPAGFASYRLAADVITFVHTEVTPERERRGLGTRLIRDALDDARARGLAVRPQCPFVAAFIDRNPEYGDLVRSS